MTIAVDLDGTLAEHCSHKVGVGAPVPAMMKRVRQWLAEGKKVKIFTARAGNPEQVELIKIWLKEQGLPDLEVTNVKGFDMIEFWDDRAHRVVMNKGVIDNQDS
jgi:hypothetical protein